MNVSTAAPDVSGEVTTALSGLDGELLAVIPAALVVGAIPFAAKRAWKFFKSLAS